LKHGKLWSKAHFSLFGNPKLEWKIVVKGSFFFVWESKIRVENSKLKDLDKFSTSHPLKVREEAEKN
jgi:hypothetical protein